ncbi:MAG: hypothetical protein GY816_14185 [Cytophagales bacterium]|nr:hypothetical protein [Cytophagales bacterium]
MVIFSKRSAWPGRYFFLTKNGIFSDDTAPIELVRSSNCVVRRGHIMEMLEPYVQDMEVTIVINMYLAPPSHQMPKSIFNNWMGIRSWKRRGCENHLELIRALFQNQASWYANDWTPVLVKEMMYLFVTWFVEWRAAQLYEDLYHMAYNISKGYIWKLIEGRAMHIREAMETKLPPFWYIGIPMEDHYDEDVVQRSTPRLFVKYCRPVSV